MWLLDDVAREGVYGKRGTGAGVPRCHVARCHVRLKGAKVPGATGSRKLIIRRERGVEGSDAVLTELREILREFCRSGLASSVQPGSAWLTARRLEELDAWQLAFSLSKRVDQLTSSGKCTTDEEFCEGSGMM